MSGSFADVAIKVSPSYPSVSESRYRSLPNILRQCPVCNDTTTPLAGNGGVRSSSGSTWTIVSVGWGLPDVDGHLRSQPLLRAVMCIPTAFATTPSNTLWSLLQIDTGLQVSKVRFRMLLDTPFARQCWSCRCRATRTRRSASRRAHDSGVVRR